MCVYGETLRRAARGYPGTGSIGLLGEREGAIPEHSRLGRERLTTDDWA
jgi:hypothetical protein